MEVLAYNPHLKAWRLVEVPGIAPAKARTDQSILAHLGERVRSLPTLDNPLTTEGREGAQWLDLDSLYRALMTSTRAKFKGAHDLSPASIEAIVHADDELYRILEGVLRGSALDEICRTYEKKQARSLQRLTQEQVLWKH